MKTAFLRATLVAAILFPLTALQASAEPTADSPKSKACCAAKAKAAGECTAEKAVKKSGCEMTKHDCIKAMGSEASATKGTDSSLTKQCCIDAVAAGKPACCETKEVEPTS